MTALTVQRDRIHRYWPWAFATIIVALTAASEGAASSTFIVAAVVGLLAFGLSWLFGRERLVITETSITEKGWVLETTVNFADVVEHELRLDADALEVDDSGLGELFLSMLGQITLRPLRWIIRMIIHRNQPDEFYRGVLTLYGYERKRLMTIEAKHGWADILAVFERITHQLETGPTPVPQARLVVRDR